MAKQELQDICAKHEITISYTEVPSEKPYRSRYSTKPFSGFVHEKPATQKGDGPWLHRKFKVTLLKSGKPVDGDPWEFSMGLPQFPKGKTIDPDPAKVRRYEEEFVKRIPDVLDVVYSLLSDASAYESARDFADFAASFGWSDDSIRSKAIYDSCGETSKRIRWILGPAFEDFVKAAADY